MATTTAYNNDHNGVYKCNDDITIPSIELDRNRFNTMIDLVAIRMPIKLCNLFLRELQDYTYDRYSK